MDAREVFNKPLHKCKIYLECSFADSEGYCSIVGKDLDKMRDCGGTPRKTLLKVEKERVKKEKPTLFEEDK